MTLVQAAGNVKLEKPARQCVFSRCRARVQLNHTLYFMRGVSADKSVVR